MNFKKTGKKYLNTGQKLFKYQSYSVPKVETIKSKYYVCNVAVQKEKTLIGGEPAGVY